MSSFANTEELKIKILKRQYFIIKVINFIEIMTLREIGDIQGFSFLADTGNDFGGEEYTVKYNSRVVFSVRLQSTGYQVSNFNESLDWQNKLEGCIKHAKELLWEFEKEEEIKKNKFEDERKRRIKREKRKSLLREAKRLKIIKVI